MRSSTRAEEIEEDVSDIAIRVENLSKAYRLGKTEQGHETLLGAAAAVVLAPIRNFRQLRRLARFDEEKKTVDAGAGANVFAENRTANSSELPPDQMNRIEESDAIWALRDISLEVRHGEVLGVIGGNGAGKSTLLRILSRITEPTKGRALVYGRVGSLLEVGTGFHPDLTGRENVYLNATVLGMKKREVDAKFDQIVEFSGVERFIDTPVKRYSSGMRVRLAFAVAAHLEPEVLVVDEVLAVGDAGFQRKCLGRMQEVSTRGRTVLFVSHDMEAIATLCHRAIVLSEGRIVFDGDSEDAIHHYHAQFSNKSGDNPLPHIIYQESRASKSANSRIQQIEVLDADAQPSQDVGTWDSLRLRIRYHLAEAVPTCSLILDIRDQRGNRLCVLDSGDKIRFGVGTHVAECRITQLPLAAGEYFLGAGLADSRSAWIWRRDRLGMLRVLGRDVYGLGRPPSSSRMLFALPHSWESVQ